jgi:hypothetical protein
MTEIARGVRRKRDVEEMVPAPLAWSRTLTGLLLFAQALLVVELFVLAAEGRWMHAALTLFLAATFATSLIFRSRFHHVIPYEVQIFAVIFLFCTIFLGEVRDYYLRLWWWDLALHASSGVLLGMLGVIVVFLMNERESGSVHLSPAFIALFAFFFSIGLGALWEIFEFAMDQIFGLTMQKPMLGDLSGLTDTMWDLIVDALGAILMSIAGFRYLRRTDAARADSWLHRWLDRRQARRNGA